MGGSVQYTVLYSTRYCTWPNAYSASRTRLLLPVSGEESQRVRGVVSEWVEEGAEGIR